MRATLVADIDGPVVRTLAVEPPLGTKLRLDGRAAVEVWLLSTGATLLEGDELCVRLRARGGARVHVRSVASQLVHPCPMGRPARWDVHVVLEDEASLCWWPEPTIVAAGANYRARATVTMAAGARLAWADELVLGRSGESAGDVALHTELRVDGPGGPRVRDGFSDHPGWLGPAVTGGARYLGTRVVTGPGPGPGDAPAGPGWTPLAGGGWSRRLVADDVATGRRQLGVDDRVRS